MLGYSGEELLQSCPSGLDKLLVESVEPLQTMFLWQRLGEGERRNGENIKHRYDNLHLLSTHPSESSKETPMYCSLIDTLSDSRRLKVLSFFNKNKTIYINNSFRAQLN